MEIETEAVFDLKTTSRRLFNPSLFVNSSMLQNQFVNCAGVTPRATKAQRHKGTKAQRHKGTKAQRHKGTKAQSGTGWKARLTFRNGLESPPYIPERAGKPALHFEAGWKARLTFRNGLESPPYISERAGKPALHSGTGWKARPTF
jgi:hypothetical protein